jgi:hypothetical protein
MKSIFSKIDFEAVFATCLVARLILTWVLTAPRSFAVFAVIYGALMLAAWIPTSRIGLL